MRSQQYLDGAAMMRKMMRKRFIALQIARAKTIKEEAPAVDPMPVEEVRQIFRPTAKPKGHTP